MSLSLSDVLRGAWVDTWLIELEDHSSAHKLGLVVDVLGESSVRQEPQDRVGRPNLPRDRLDTRRRNL